MNTKKSAAVTGAIVLLIAISGCAGVRAQLEAGNGASSITSLQSQQDSARQEAAQQRRAAHSSDTASAQRSMQLQEQQRAVKQAEQRAQHPQAVTGNVAQFNELVRSSKQAESTGRPSAADMQGQRLTQYAEQLSRSSSDEVPTPTPQPRPISPRNR